MTISAAVYDTFERLEEKGRNAAEEKPQESGHL
jgi:hypothetical protein